ncbi:MAG: amidohydrolase [Nitrospinae bacterium]|nr:amidohydrolase [Nitrospinota bacterium]
MILKFRVFAIIFVALGILPFSAFSQSADIALVNGKILTVDADFSVQQAVAVQGERVLSIGGNSQIKQLIDSSTKVIDLQGKTLIPGLIDNHVHFIRHALRWDHEARIDGVTSRKKALAVIAAKAKSLKPGEWVLILGGWSPGQFRDKPGLFTKAELDLASPNNPVFIQQSYRFMILNSLALKKTGIDENFDAPRGWRVARNESGAPTGVIRGRRAIFRFWRRELPEVTDDKTVSGLKKLMADFNRAGVTSVFELGGGGVRDATYEMIRRRLADNDGLSLRIFHTPRFRVRTPEANKSVIERVRNSRPDKSAKMMGNIALGEHMYAPLHDSAFRPSRFPDEDYAEFAKVSEAAADGGWTIHEHAFRNTTITRYLDIFEKINQKKDITNLRWSIHHADFISKRNIERARALGMTFALHSKMTILGSTLRRRYGDRALSLPPLRTVQNSGAIWGLGTDAGVVAPYPPMLSLWWAVTGMDLGGQRALSEAETVSRKDALIAHTRSNAYLFFKENELGTIEKGKFADLVVLDRDYMTVPEDRIKDIEPLLTMVGGKIVFRSGI